MTSALVAWCVGCETYMPIDEIGECPTCWRKLRKRRGFICEKCNNKRIFFTRAGFEEHRHD